MKRTFLFCALLALMSGCGDSAPSDSAVTGPADGGSTLASSTEGSNVIFGPLDFSVRDPDGDVIPDVEIQFFRGGNALLSDIDGNLLGNPNQLTTSTNDRGVARISVVIAVPGCVDATNIVASGTVLGTVATASHLWTATITRTCTTTTAP